MPSSFCLNISKNAGIVHVCLNFTNTMIIGQILWPVIKAKAMLWSAGVVTAEEKALLTICHCKVKCSTN